MRKPALSSCSDSGLGGMSHIHGFATLLPTRNISQLPSVCDLLAQALGCARGPRAFLWRVWAVREESPQTSHRSDLR